jgi:hypothetical protein
MRRNLVSWGLRPLRFLDYWWDYPNSLGISKRRWEEVWLTEPNQYRVVRKLSKLRVLLWQWNASSFDNLEHQLMEEEGQIHGLDIIKEGQGLSKKEKNTYR